MASLSMAEQEMVVMQLRAVSTVARSLEEEQLQRFVEAREHAMAIGPLFQPTSWLEHGFDDDRNWVKLAEKCGELRMLIREITGQ